MSMLSLFYQDANLSKVTAWALQVYAFILTHELE